MQLAKVIGTVVVTRKDESLTGITLLLVQPLNPDRQPSGKPLVAVDSVGAGVGEDVFFVRGKEASFPFYPAEPPVDAGIVGIVDHWDLG
jgi:ethanolamine utilization protein EutN